MYSKAATSLVTTDSLLGLARFLATVPKERAEAVVSTDDDFERVHSGWHREFGIAGLRVPTDAIINKVLRSLLGMSSLRSAAGFRGVWHPAHAWRILDMLEHTRTCFAVSAKANVLLAEPRLLAQARGAIGELRYGHKRAEALEQSKFGSVLSGSLWMYTGIVNVRN